MPACRSRRRGFTLIELLVVLGIISLMLTLAVPRFFPSIDKTREVILADTLRTTRATIDQYYGDTGRYPDTLDELVEKKYLRAVPVDPVAESDVWIIVPPDETAKGKIYSIRSSATGLDRNGKAYADW